MAEILTVFRSRLRGDAYDNGYGDHAAAMVERARSMPGFVSYKSFASDDGERVSVIVFASAEDQQRWASDEDHRDAQRAGVKDYYTEYSIEVAEIVRSRSWQRS
jgi:heme-degrading monooxygenase HmoA